MGEIVPFGLRLQGFRQSWLESRDGRAAKLGSQAVAVQAGVEREQLETGVQSYAALRQTRRVTMRVKVKDRRETVNPLNIVPEIEVIVKKREIWGIV